MQNHEYTKLDLLSQEELKQLIVAYDEYLDRNFGTVTHGIMGFYDLNFLPGRYMTVVKIQDKEDRTTGIQLELNEEGRKFLHGFGPNSNFNRIWGELWEYFKANGWDEISYPGLTDIPVYTDVPDYRTMPDGEEVCEADYGFYYGSWYVLDPVEELLDGPIVMAKHEFKEE